LTSFGLNSVPDSVWTENFWSKPRIWPEPNRKWLKSCHRGFRPGSVWTQSQTRFEPGIFCLIFGWTKNYTKNSIINKGSNGDSRWHVQ
jgi:hypothetical protein